MSKLIIIKKILELYKNGVYDISGSDLKTSEEEYEDEFIQKLKNLEKNGFLELQCSSSSNMPYSVFLTPKGAFEGRQYIENYDKIFEDVVSVIDIDKRDDSKTISSKVKISQIYVSAVFEDLKSKNYVELKKYSDRLSITNITDRGIDFFNNINK